MFVPKGKIKLTTNTSERTNFHMDESDLRDYLAWHMNKSFRTFTIVLIWDGGQSYLF